MMLQGMQAAAAAQGLPHTLQSPPNSGGPGFLLLPGMGHHHQGQQGRDISPNSTPSLSGHPPPSATPPNMGDLSDRNWATQAAQHNLLFGISWLTSFSAICQAGVNFIIILRAHFLYESLFKAKL